MTTTTLTAELFDVPELAIVLCAGCVKEMRAYLEYADTPTAPTDAARCEQCGRPASVTFERFHTTAPEAFDGFGTITLEPNIPQPVTGLPGRIVGILPEAREWQTTRYFSGCYGAQEEV